MLTGTAGREVDVGQSSANETAVRYLGDVYATLLAVAALSDCAPGSHWATPGRWQRDIRATPLRHAKRRMKGGIARRVI